MPNRYRINLKPDYYVKSVLESIFPCDGSDIQWVGLCETGDVIHCDERITNLSNATSQTYGIWSRRPSRLKDFSEGDITDFSRMYGYDPDEIRELVELARKYGE